MKCIYAFLFLLAVVSAENEEQPSTPQEILNKAPEETKLEEDPSPPLIPAPTGLEDNKARPQRHVLLRNEIPTLLVPTYDLRQFYILVDQPRYAPWYYPVLPVKEKPDKQEKPEKL